MFSLFTTIDISACQECTSNIQWTSWVMRCSQANANPQRAIIRAMVWHCSLHPSTEGNPNFMIRSGDSSSPQQWLCGSLKRLHWIGRHLMLPQHPQRNCFYTSIWGTGQGHQDKINTGVSTDMYAMGKHNALSIIFLHYNFTCMHLHYALQSTTRILSLQQCSA